MSPRFILGRENVPCVAEVVNRSLKADCTDYNSFNNESFTNCLCFKAEDLFGIEYGSGVERRVVCDHV